MRPSDALALALRTDSPIYVAEEVLEQAGEFIPQEFADGATSTDSFYSLVRGAGIHVSPEELERLAPKYVAPWFHAKDPEEQQSTCAEGKEEPAPYEQSKRRLMRFVFGDRE